MTLALGLKALRLSLAALGLLRRAQGHWGRREGLEVKDGPAPTDKGLGAAVGGPVQLRRTLGLLMAALQASREVLGLLQAALSLLLTLLLSHHITLQHYPLWVMQHVLCCQHLCYWDVGKSRACQKHVLLCHTTELSPGSSFVSSSWNSYAIFKGN